MVDLHTHSDASDGESTPSELIELARQAGITALALTDHDTLAGIPEAMTAANEAGIRLIPGVETEVEFQPGEFHLLGLGMNRFEEGPLEDFLGEIRRRRVTRNEEMVGLMREDNRNVSIEVLDAIAGGDVTGRMHFARWLISEGLARNVPDAFEKWLGPGRPYHVAKNRPKLQEALDAIHESGGLAVIAHPLSLWISWGRLRQFLPEWKEMGLDGVEARHSGASAREAVRFEELADQHGMFITGGSDYHGSGRPDRTLGHGSAGKPLEETLLAPWDHD